MRCGFAAALLAAVGTPTFAHRLDEYLQAAILSVEKDRLEVRMTLTPGVAVFPILISQIDTDADGMISEAERQAYGRQVLRDLSFTLDGKLLMPHLVSMQFPITGDMQQGRGEIKLNISAPLSAGLRSHRLVFQNRHQGRISVYQVNCLVPRDPDIRITKQERNWTQSSYRLEYARKDAGGRITSAALWFGGFGWLGLTTLFLLKRRVRIE